MTITVNGRAHTVEAEPDTPLLWVLRDSLGLTGTKYGCGIGACGACTVLMGDVAVRSCQLPAAASSGKSFTTIEGLSPTGTHPVQRAWVDEDVAQCGYCQPGMIMSACALLKAKANPTDADINATFDQHVCRCGSYSGIRRAVHKAAGQR